VEDLLSPHPHRSQIDNRRWEQLAAGRGPAGRPPTTDRFVDTGDERQGQINER
jgi:hypothetical protein